MAESLFTSQTPSVSANDGGPGIVTATTVQFATAGTITHVRFYASNAGFSGTWTGAVWQVLTTDDSPSGTLLGSKTLAGSSVTPDAWNTVALDTPISVATGVLYRVGLHTPSAYVATNSFFVSSLTSGNITAPANGADPVGLGSLKQGVFVINASLTYPSSVGLAASYFVDVVFEAGSAPGAGTAALGLSLELSAYGSASSAPTQLGSWYGLLAISQEAREMCREDQAAAAKPVDCWYDGEPLLDGHCRFCGRMYGR